VLLLAHIDFVCYLSLLVAVFFLISILLSREKPNLLLQPKQLGCLVLKLKWKVLLRVIVAAFAS
jgi:hypothetical protein